MSEPKFTPKPWQRIGMKVCDADGFPIAKCGWFSQSVEEAMANGDLLAAAPEMYEMLSEAIRIQCHICPFTEFVKGEYICARREDQCFVKRWKYVLAKARGERQDEKDNRNN